MTNSDTNFYFPSSSSLLIPNHNQKLRKNRTKLNKIEPNLVPSSTNIPYSIVANRKKQDPSAPKITKPCTECGKKFWSEKALYGHMRCHPERQWRGINPPPNYCRPISTTIRELGNNNKNASQAVMTTEDHEVAACLLLLSNSDSAAVTYATSSSNFQVEEDVMNCRFECSSCKKVFGSHQALGGHRASHKNVKGCFAITSSDGCEIVDEDHGGDCSGGGRTIEDNSFNNNNKMLMVFGHKCSICLRVFSSGQALGGHKRCHWEKGEEAASSSMNQAKEICGLDLNLPASVDHQDESSFSCSSGLTLDLRLGL